MPLTELVLIAKSNGLFLRPISLKSDQIDISSRRIVSCDPHLVKLASPGVQLLEHSVGGFRHWGGSKVINLRQG
jgi:hypothetical protein